MWSCVSILCVQEHGEAVISLQQERSALLTANTALTAEAAAAQHQQQVRKTKSTRF